MTLDIDEQLANFRDARALVVESLDDIDTKIAALLNAKKLLSANVKVAVTQFNGQENPSKFIPTQAHIINVKQPDVDISSIRGCASIPEAMFAWADAHGGELLGKELASAIRIAGISKAKNDNSAAATIQNFAVKAYAKHWEKTGSNHFRRLYPADEAPSPQSTVPDRLGVERPSEHSLAAD
ncbi:hypothetical protein GBAR_LOCUS7938 [Geodia barretti]|jgi:hypothetical protein|uniref:Uncharacterized protein n=1 Tax=Geodia barretti TaxID=519541 RepID=A0AA35WF99_GEOBA|nr:hypothetical protein GBAR_LOCUS7938 [Geodia barretti]